MSSEIDITRIIEVEVANGEKIKVEATAYGDQRVGYSLGKFDEVTKTIESIAADVTESLKKIKPDEASIEFGVELATESGQLAALLVKGSAKANLKITVRLRRQCERTEERCASIGRVKN